MNSRLLHIVVAQIIALILWGIYVHHRIARLEYFAEQSLVRGFNQGVDAMAAQASHAGLIRTDEQMRKLHQEQEALQKESADWVGLEDHIVVSLLAIPAGALSVLVIIALLVEAKSRRTMSNSAESRQRMHTKAVDF